LAHLKLKHHAKGEESPKIDLFRDHQEKIINEIKKLNKL